MRIKDYILPIVAVLLALIYFFTGGEKSVSKKFLIDNKLSIKKIKYKSDDLDITFEKKNGKWMIIKPETWPANSSQIDKLVDLLKETEVVAEIKDSDYGKYEFDEGDNLILNDGKVELIIGKKDKSYRLVYVKKEEVIYLVDGAFTNYLPLTLNQIKDKTVYRVDNIDKFNLNVDNTTISFENKMNEYFYNGKKLSKEEADCVKKKVAVLKANTFADNNTLPESAKKVGYLLIKSSKFDYKFTIYKDKDGDFYIPYKNQVFDIYSFNMEDFTSAIKDCIGHN